MPVWRQGRVTTVQRWFQWLEDRGGMNGHPMAAVLAALLSALIARPADAERWANVVDRRQYGDTTHPDDPSTEAWAALLRAILCRHGLKQMREDADEAVHRFATESFVTSAPALMQGVARVLSGDLDGGDAALEDAASVAEKVGADEDSCSRSANERWWRLNAANGTAQRSLATRHTPPCAGPCERRVTPRPWSPRRKPGQSCTGVTSRQCASTLSARSGSGLC